MDWTEVEVLCCDMISDVRVACPRSTIITHEVPLEPTSRSARPGHKR
jgi:hypothetical protein